MKNTACNYTIGCKLQILAVCIGLFLIVCTPANAQKITPSDAFDKAAYLGLMVERLMQRDLLDSALPKDPEVVPARPRHVLQLATIAFEGVQALRKLNGFPVNHVNQMEAEETKPIHVVERIDAAIKDLAELGAVYGADLNIQDIVREEDKKPSHVLARLRAVNAGLHKLGIPKVLPNDVFRVALSIRDQARKVARLRGVSAEPRIETLGSASPAAALEEAMDLISDLGAMSRDNPDFALPKGVAHPPRPAKGKPVAPGDVLLAVQFACADVYSLTVKLGNKDPLVLPPEQSGRNPSDVRNTLALARAYLAAVAATN